MSAESPAMNDADYFLEKADQCFSLSRLAGANRELQLALDSLAHEFMSKAVELDTERDRTESSGGRR
jgi:hypothetical protein